MSLLIERARFNKTQRGIDTSFALQTLEKGWVTKAQITRCRISMNRYLQRKGTVWVQPLPFSDKWRLPSRPGKGKGGRWVAVIKSGCLLFRVSGVPETKARTALNIASATLGVRTQVVPYQ